MPVTVVTGPRQAGKTTLVRDLGDPARPYYSLDDFDVFDQADRDPADLVQRAPRMTIDEVQRAPRLMVAVKQVVDAARSRGQFILTGSANLLLMRQVGDSLAGRASYITLHPLTRREQYGLGSAGLWGELLDVEDRVWPEVLQDQVLGAEDWTTLARRGGFPTPAVELDSDEERGLWFESYLATYLQRDLQDLSAISALPDFRRLMKAVCLRAGQLMNQTELGRDVQLPQPTVHRYLNLLETSWQVVRLPAYSVNRTKRLIKAPKLYWHDTGMAVHLAGQPPGGAQLENMVVNDVIAWRDALRPRAEVSYWRTASGEEVDLVIEDDGMLLAVEIKATTKPRLADARHLQSFREEHGKHARAALLLHAGDRIEWLAPGILAAPWWSVV